MTPLSMRPRVVTGGANGVGGEGGDRNLTILTL